MSTTVYYKDIVKQMNRDLEGFFDKYDSDHNKKITRQEMEDALARSGKKNPEKITAFLFRNDTDKNGELSIDEVKVRIGRMNSENIENVLNWDVERFIQQNDKNGDGKITRQEVLQRFTQQGALDPERITDGIFRQMDLNKDDEITANEIKEYNRKKKFSFLDSSAPKQ
ncbi:hypothetical protein RB653_007737 [Dictyostelium firmibasis]|uniref:EF-hand domain-containing protein n=1 Tax=Dictyostelium firmibasis TaxID=79012 RepID=A0AAN7TW45_9MYCE